MCQNISGENLRLLKSKIGYIIGYICEIFCNVASGVLQTLLCCYSFQQNFSRFKIFIRHIHNYTEYNQQLNVIGQLPTASGVLLMVSRIIYLN